MSSIVLKGSTSGTVTLQPAATISPNVTFTLPSTDGSAGQVLATNGSGTLSFITNDGSASYQAANSAGAYANAAFIAANTPSSIANTANAKAQQSYDFANTVNVHVQSVYNLANTLFSGTADPNVDVLTANTVTSVNVISSNILTANNLTVSNNFSVAGVTVVWHDAPTTSKGSSGDKAGFVAIDNDKIYRCVADYTDGTVDIWKYINFTGGTWG
jgi:hypothetical protein